MNKLQTSTNNLFLALACASALLISACGASGQCKPLAAWSGPGATCAKGVKVATAPTTFVPPEEKWDPPPEPDPTIAPPEPVVEELPEPEPEPEPVRVGEDSIDFDGKVEFKKSKAKLLPESRDLLDKVAQVLVDNPDILKVEIQGHTDSRGRERKNRRLSKKRAKAVLRYLRRKGVSRRRMTAKGYGSDNPIADNDTEEGREENRRVEIEIKKRR